MVLHLFHFFENRIFRCLKNFGKCSRRQHKQKPNLGNALVVNMSKKKFGEAHYTIFRKIHFENFGEFWKSGKNSKVFRAHKMDPPHFFFKQGNDAFLWKKQMLFFCKNFKIISFCTERKWNPKWGGPQSNFRDRSGFQSAKFFQEIPRPETIFTTCRNSRSITRWCGCFHFPVPHN